MKILVVDDHPVFLAGIIAVLKNDPNINIVGTAENGEIAIQKANELQPDIVIMDISMPGIDGIEATKQILDKSEKIKVLALSIHTGKRFVKEMLNAGASGYLPKDVAADEIVTAIAQISKGNMYLSPTITSVALSDSSVPMDDFNANVLKTKLNRPPVMIDFVIRKSIIEKLEKNREKPLSLIVAPPGYGKSVTVSEWLENTKALHVWISLDEELNQLKIFLQYMITAIEQIFPGTFIETSKLIRANELPSVHIIALTLINELDLINQDYILVLDDYQKISNESIHKLLGEILQYPPEHMHLSIITRRDPPIALQRLRMSSRLLDVRMKDLSFSELEVKELFIKLHNIELSDTITKSLTEETEGWITGICLAMMNIKEPDKMERLPMKMGSDLYPFSEFLLEEVLSKLDEEFKNILLSISVSDRFCNELIDAILKVDSEFKGNLDGNGFIEQLVSSNLFVIPLDSQNKWFRFHHLFQELLQGQLKKQKSKKAIEELHRIVGNWFEENAFIDEAISHAVKTNEIETVALVIERNRENIVNADKAYILDRWLNIHPEVNLLQRPGLIMAKSWALMHKMQFEEIFANMEIVEKLCGDDKQFDSIIGEVAFFRGYMHYFLGDGNTSLKYLETALEKIPLTYYEARGQTEIIYALSCQMVGNKEYAIQFIDTLFATPGPTNEVRTSRLLATYVFIYILTCDFENATQANTRLFNAVKNRLVYSEVWSSYLQGIIHLFSFELDKSIDFLIASVNERYNHFKRSAVDSITTLMLAYQVSGQTEKANNTLQILHEYLSTTNDPAYQLLLNSASLRLALLQGNTEQVLNIRKSITLPTFMPAMTWWVDILEITYCRALIAENTSAGITEAGKKLDELKAFCEAHHNQLHLIEVLLLKSLVLAKIGKNEAAETLLSEALVLAQPSSILFPFVEIGFKLEALLLAVELDTVKVFRNRIVDVLRANNEQRNVNSLSTISLKEDRMGSRISNSISYRQKEIVQLVADGFRNKEIADKLFISENTVKKHLYNIFQNYDVKNRISLIEKAKELGLLENR